MIAMTRERKSLVACPPETRRRYGEQVVWEELRGGLTLAPPA